MTPEQQAEIKRLIQNSELIQKKMSELTEIFKKNITLIETLTNGFTPAQASAAVNGTPLNVVEQSILTAVATLAAKNTREVPRQWLAVVANRRPKSSQYNTALARLLKRGLLLTVPRTGMISPSETLSAAPEEAFDWSELMRRFAGLFDSKEADIVYQLLIHAYDYSVQGKDDWLDRKTLAERALQNIESSAFRERLTSLKANGFIAYGPNSTVRATIDWLAPVEAYGK